MNVFKKVMSKIFDCVDEFNLRHSRYFGRKKVFAKYKPEQSVDKIDKKGKLTPEEKALFDKYTTI